MSRDRFRHGDGTVNKARHVIRIVGALLLGVAVAGTPALTYAQHTGGGGGGGGGGHAGGGGHMGGPMGGGHVSPGGGHAGAPSAHLGGYPAVHGGVGYRGAYGSRSVYAGR